MNPKQTADLQDLAIRNAQYNALGVKTLCPTGLNKQGMYVYDAAYRKERKRMLRLIARAKAEHDKPWLSSFRKRGRVT